MRTGATDRRGGPGRGRVGTGTGPSGQEVHDLRRVRGVRWQVVLPVGARVAEREEVRHPVRVRPWPSPRHPTPVFLPHPRGSGHTTVVVTCGTELLQFLLQGLLRGPEPQVRTPPEQDPYPPSESTTVRVCGVGLATGTGTSGPSVSGPSVGGGWVLNGPSTSDPWVTPATGTSRRRTTAATSTVGRTDA